MRTCQPVPWAGPISRLVVLLFLAACAPQPVPPVESTFTPVSLREPQAVETAVLPEATPSAGADPQQAALLQFILSDLGGTEKQHLLAAQVKPNPNDPRGNLDLAAENILRCWLYQDGSLRDCPADFFAQNYTQETGVPWKYAYIAFSLNEVSPDFRTATVRIDQIPGLAGGRGDLFELARDGEQWMVKSKRNAWIQ